MTKEKFLTVRWNNLLSLGLGIPALIYVVVVLSTSLMSDKAAFIGLALIGVLYWTIVEQHSAMRFAWLRKNSAIDAPVKQSSTGRLIYIAYNVIYWIPIVLTVTKVIDYRMGFISFFLVILTRAIANLYRNNVLTPEQGEYFAFRSP